MVYMLMNVFLVRIHLKEGTYESMSNDQKQVFKHLVVGVNVRSLFEYQRVADAVLRIPPERIKTITRDVFIATFLNGEDFVDESGELV